jgi:hypothetical protein
VPVVENPTGIEAAADLVKVGEEAVLPMVLIVVLAAPAAVLVRFWHSRGEERQQLKWLAYAAGLWVGVAALDALNQHVLRDPAVDYATNVLFGAAVAPIPVAVGIAILRYRLYDIDLIINRTLVYGSLTATLALVHGGSGRSAGGLTGPHGPGVHPGSRSLYPGHSRLVQPAAAAGTGAGGSPLLPQKVRRCKNLSRLQRSVTR